MAEEQQKAAIDLKRKALDARTKRDNKGQNFALAVSVLMIGCATFLIAAGNQISGTIPAGGTLVGLAYVFLTGRKRNSRQPD